MLRVKPTDLRGCTLSSVLGGPRRGVREAPRAKCLSGWELHILRSLHKWSLSRGEAGGPAESLGSTHASEGNLDELLIF